MKKVLLIDDDVFLTKLYTTLLQTEGMQVGVANGGADAISLLPSFHPDVVVLDLHMPEISGVDVLRFIRSRAESRNLPVVVFSNGYVQRMVDEVGGLGVQKVLSKLQCKPRQLVQEIKALLEESPAVAPSPETRSALQEAAGHAAEESIEHMPTWMHRLCTDSRPQARRICLIHIYKIVQETLERALVADASLPRGKLGRALKKLLDDLFEHPGQVTESTMKVLGHSLQKLFDLCAKSGNEKLESESVLQDVLSDLED